MRLLAALPLVFVAAAHAQPAADLPPLTVEQIMQAPETWIGAWPEMPFWTDAGDRVYFRWNPQGRFDGDSLFAAPATGGDPEQLAPAERRALAPRHAGFHADPLTYSADRQRRVYEDGGDLYLYDLAADERRRLTRTPGRESDPRFHPDDAGRVVFVRGDNVYALDLDGGIEQLTDLRSGTAPADADTTEQRAYLFDQQERLFETLREARRRRLAADSIDARDEAARGLPPTHYVGGRTIGQLQVDPTERFATFTLSDEQPSDPTLLVDFVTESGYAEEISARPKVGDAFAASDFFVHDLQRDTVYQVDFRTLPGATDPPDYAVERGETADSSRAFSAFGPYWNRDGSLAVLDVRTRDNKDRWIARLDPATGALASLDRQRDEAWIAGPGISWWGGGSDLGWLPGGRRLWFQSERTGYSHLYTVDVPSGEVRAVTGGDFEVESAVLTPDGRHFVFQSSEGSPYERHVWRVGVDGGARERLTHRSGRTDFALHPSGDRLALLHSTSNRPPEVHVMALGGAPVQITDSPMPDWLRYGWQEAEIVEVPASDGARVPARIYRPEDHGAAPNGAAVLFVHGAGYLQNVHNWWSGYFREWMFHHLLAQQGYVVLDLDYRASAGYGRDWRTAVYRHMGGRDLQDYVDASRWLGETRGVDPERVAIYGGSYGGFITLMALFTEPEHFGGGAALRAVTDWAHYNEVYTGNILNAPAADPVAYARSSPIEFAEGLEDPLVICHGLIDANVQPQDVFRLAQRLIELGKEDWELALYPVEGHGFTEPSSWTDEYRRVLDLVEQSVGEPVPAERGEG
jgi:dipeptidyl aminopeptidase/acylaminoacyl peptidase